MAIEAANLMIDTEHIFEKARTCRRWLKRPLEDDLIKRVYHRAAMGPTSLNCQPMRLVIVKSQYARCKLLPLLDKGNVEKTAAAPITVIFAYDRKFFLHLPCLLPGRDVQQLFVNDKMLAEETAVRNANLQAAYFMLSARSFGLDVGPMSGFDRRAVDTAFFGDTQFRSNFLCNIGYGDYQGLGDRNPRLGFEEACEFA